MCPISVSVSSVSPYNDRLGKIWILLIGVNKYQDEQLPSLQCSMSDCRGLEEALTEATEGFRTRWIMSHHDESEKLPELENIRASLQKIIMEAKQEDTILVYFSGHGMLETESQQVVLCLADTQKSDLLSTGLGLNEVLGILGKSSAEQQIVWLDACHSGGMTLWGARSETVEPLPDPTDQILEVLRQRATQSKGFYALLSCDKGEKSWEFPKLKHGLFTYYIIQGLRGESADYQGVISLDRLYTYAYHQTRQYINNINHNLLLFNQQNRERGESQVQKEYPQQTPKRIVEGSGEIILGLKKPELAISNRHLRQALVVDGLTSTQEGGLNLAKVLSKAGGFEVHYSPQSEEDTAVRKAIDKLLSISNSCPNPKGGAKTATVLLYLRGQIEETEEGQAWLVLGNGTKLYRSWLRDRLRHAGGVQQIIVLDCLGTSSLERWVEDLQDRGGLGQCLLAATAPEPERFNQALLKTLRTEDPVVGLTVAGWITKLQKELVSAGIRLHPWLSGIQGVIEVLPSQSRSQGIKTTQGIDLGVCPYRGLSAFREKDAQFFEGRETLTQKLLNSVYHKLFLAVVGPSGGGKSSIVQAALIPELRAGRQIPGSEQWWVGSFNPGDKPLVALSRRLANSGTQRKVDYQQIQEIKSLVDQGVKGFVQWIRTRPEPMVVLIIDQFEEIFTTASAEDRQLFLKVVLGALEDEDAAKRFKLTIVVRSDFITQCLAVPALHNAMDSQVWIPPYLTPEEYRQVVVNPAEKVGLSWEPELVELLIQHLSQITVTLPLPLLELILEQVWFLCHHQGCLTLQAYQQLGGIEGVIERKLKQVYDNELTSEEQLCAKWIFLNLIRLGEGTEHTRQRKLKSELIVKKYPPLLVERVLQKLTSAKLLVMNSELEKSAVGQSRGASEQQLEPDELGLERLKEEETVEVIHESLIRCSPTMNGWLEENRTNLQQRQEIIQEAQNWDKRGRWSDFLLQGVRLAEAVATYIRESDELPAVVHDFMIACQEERDRAVQEKERQRQRQLLQERKARKAAQRQTFFAFLFAIVLSVVAIVAVGQWRDAQITNINALTQNSEASLLLNKQLEALIAAVQASKKSQNSILLQNATVSQTARAALQRAVFNVQERNRFEGHSSEVYSVVFSPDGKTLASSGQDAIRLWDVNTGKEQKPLSEIGFHSIVFSPDGKTLASTLAPGSPIANTIILWDVATGKAIKALTGHRYGVNSVVFSPDGKTLASGSQDKTVKFWNVATGKEIKTLIGHSNYVNSVVFSPDGKTLASGSIDKTVKLWDVTTGKEIKTLTRHSGHINSVVFSPDGKTLAFSSSSYKTVTLWDVGIGMKIKDFWSVDYLDGSGAFSPDGRILAFGMMNGSIELWDAATGVEIKILSEHSSMVTSVVFSPDGKTLASASNDQTIKLWDLTALPVIKTLNGHSSKVNKLFLSPDGKILAYGSNDKTTKFWDVATGNVTKTLNQPSSEVYSSFLSPDGKTLVSSSYNTIKLWNVATGKEIKTLTGHSSESYYRSFLSPDGKILASIIGSNNETIKLWDVATGKKIKILTGHSSMINSVVFSPDGSTLASGSDDNTIKLWNVATGKEIKTLTGHSNMVRIVVFSPDSSTLASGSYDNTVKLWNVATGKEIIYPSPKRHSLAVRNVMFSPDGKTLASTSDNNGVKLWDIATGIEATTLNNAGDLNSSIVFSPDSKTIAFGSVDNIVRLRNFYPNELNDLMNLSCDRLRGYLQTNPNVSKSERTLCDGIGTQK